MKSTMGSEKARRLKQARKDLGLTQIEFGAALGLSDQTISNHETGKSEPSDATMSLLQRLLCVRTLLQTTRHQLDAIEKMLLGRADTVTVFSAVFEEMRDAEKSFEHDLGGDDDEGENPDVGPHRRSS